MLYRGRIDDLYSAGRPAPAERAGRTISKTRSRRSLPTRCRPSARLSRSALRSRLEASRQGKGETITFTKHVAPILWKNCARCHRPGAVAPFSLLTYKDAAKRADFIRDVVSSGQMPPWKPHSGAGVFRDAPRLSAVEKEILELWAENGRAEGDPADLPPLPQFNDGWQLGKPDVVLTDARAIHRSPRPARTSIGRSPCPLNLGRDLVINGVEFRPGNRRVVHHSRIYLDTTGDARRRDLADPAPGFLGLYRASGNRELPYPGLGGWTPGMTPRFAPDGVGRLVPDRSDVVLRVHYHTSGKPEDDRSSVGLFVAKKPVTRNMVGYTICSNKIDIPPGEKRHKIIISSRVKADVHLYTVVPHAHYLCREFRLAATLPDGTTQPLLWINDWDLDWQDQYRYLKPVRPPQGHAPHPRRLLRQFRGQSAQSPQAPAPRPLRPRDRRRDVRLPPRIPPRRSQRLRGLPREVAVRALTTASRRPVVGRGLCRRTFTRSARSTPVQEGDDLGQQVPLGRLEQRLKSVASALHDDQPVWDAGAIERVRPSAPTGREAPRRRPSP